MTTKKQNDAACGPFIACGAAAVSFDHQPGEPTSIDRAWNAIKGLASRKQGDSDMHSPKKAGVKRSLTIIHEH